MERNCGVQTSEAAGAFATPVKNAADQHLSPYSGISLLGGVLQYPPPVFFERDIYNYRAQIKFFLRKLHRIRSSEIKTCDIWRHFY